MSACGCGFDKSTVRTPFVAFGRSAAYFIQGVRDARGRVTVTASATGFTSQGGTLDIVAPALDIQALPSSVSATGATAVFYVRVGVANTFGTALSLIQEVAPGAAFVATLTNSVASVAQLVTTAGGAQTRTVLIAPGSSNSPTTLAAGGVAFDPLSAGDTTVTATIPGVTTTAAGVVEVTVGGG